MTTFKLNFPKAIVVAALALGSPERRASAGEPKGFLETVHRHVLLASTIGENGDVNPYAIVVAPVSSGRIQKGDVLVDNFNRVSNLQGTGTTIMDYNPTTKKITTLARLPPNVPGCPGGVGLSTAMTMLKAGWIIVGSAPSTDGTTRTKGPGALLVLDSNGQLAATWANTNINDPWGNVAIIDNGSNASLFVGMAGYGVASPFARDPKTGYPFVVNKATVVRFDLSIPEGKPPEIVKQTVIADGFGQRADFDSFLIGPTGLVLGADGTLYISDALANQVASVPDAATRSESAGTGRVVTKGGLLRRPLALTMAPNGHILVINGLNGQVVEVDPMSGKQLYAQWLVTDQAQSPPGNGDLFGIAITPDGKGFYYVADDINALMEAK